MHVEISIDFDKIVLLWFSMLLFVLLLVLVWLRLMALVRVLLLNVKIHFILLVLLLLLLFTAVQYRYLKQSSRFRCNIFGNFILYVSLANIFFGKCVKEFRFRSFQGYTRQWLWRRRRRGRRCRCRCRYCCWRRCNHWLQSICWHGHWLFNVSIEILAKSLGNDISWGRYIFRNGSGRTSSILSFWATTTGWLPSWAQHSERCSHRFASAKYGRWCWIRQTSIRGEMVVFVIHKHNIRLRLNALTHYAKHKFEEEEEQQISVEFHGGARSSVSRIFVTSTVHFKTNSIQYPVCFDVLNSSFTNNWLGLISVFVLLPFIAYLVRFVLVLISFGYMNTQSLLLSHREQIANFMAFQFVWHFNLLILWWFSIRFSLFESNKCWNGIQHAHNKMANCSGIADPIIGTFSSIFLLSNAIEWRKR